MSESGKGKWWAGSTEERFNHGPFDTREEAISEMRQEYEGDDDKPFFIGVQGDYTPFSRDFVEELLELEACDISDECGPGSSDDWPPQIDKPERDEANAKIRAILVELCGECSVFPISGSEEIPPMDEDDHDNREH